MKMLSSFSHPYVIPNLNYFLSSVENKRFLFLLMEVMGLQWLSLYGQNVLKYYLKYHLCVLHKKESHTGFWISMRFSRISCLGEIVKMLTLFYSKESLCSYWHTYFMIPSTSPWFDSNLDSAWITWIKIRYSACQSFIGKINYTK